MTTNSQPPTPEHTEGMIWCENTCCPFFTKCKRFDWEDKFLTEKWDVFHWEWSGCDYFLSDEFKTVAEAFPN